VQALRGVSLTVGEGEVVAVLGANGAGKTTTLRAISGTVSRSGVIDLDGKTLRGGPEAAARAGIAHVPEGRGTFVELTVNENLRLGAYTRRDGGIKDDLERVAGYFPWMAERGSQRAGTLSGGEQQMLGLARVLAAPPRLLIADEMSLGLAPKLVDLVFESLARARAEGVTTLLVEQYVDRALEFADDAVILRRGEAVWRGAAASAGAETLAGYLGDPAGGASEPSPAS
jgi:branched-chain amino acid transport system ATP-binding protein